MDSIFERGEAAGKSSDGASSALLCPDEFYEEALDFSKPRETAFEKATKTKNRGRFGRRSGQLGNGTLRIGGERARFMKARDDEELLDGEEGPNEIIRRRLAETPEFISKNYLAEDEAAMPPTRGRRQPPMRCQSFTAGTSSGGPSFGSGPTKANPRMPIQRSFSIAVTERTSSSSGSLSSSGFPQAANFSWSNNNAENAPPNFAGFDPLDATRERKKHRVRRHSVAGPPAIVSKSTPAATPIPPDLHWLNNAMSEEQRSIGETAAMITTPNTTSSRRKRGPNGTPVSDTGDDWIGLSGASSDYSGSRRSCIFSPTGEIQRPFDDPMEQSTDDESVPSPDTSFEHEKETKTPLPSARLHETDTRPNIEDVQYLLCELQKESKSAANGRFGKNTWNVAPPVNAWPQQRRVQFKSWAQEMLGFSVHSAGMGIWYLKISENRGAKIIETLEQMMLQLPNDSKQLPASKEPSPAHSIFSAVSSLTSPTPFLHGAKDMDFVSESNGDFEDEDLAARVSVLTVNESSSRKNALRAVTLDLDQKQPRFSLESFASKKSRCSVESHGRGINFHDMMGFSPRGPRTRPPKLSFGGAPLGKTSVKKCLPTIDTTAASAPFMNCVATPMNTEFRGWGSRPVGGRDWGASATYSNELIDILMARFEEDCRKENVRFSFESMHDEVCHMAGVQSSPNQKEAERVERRRRNDFNKRKRMSLLAHAVGTKPALPLNSRRTIMPIISGSPLISDTAKHIVSTDEKIMTNVFSFLGEKELTYTMATVSSTWYDWASIAHANLLVRSVTEAKEADFDPPLERSWNSIHDMLPWACFIAEGGAKRVYKAFNADQQRIEAVSVMDSEEIDSVEILANELAVSSLLSSLVRRGICPNFVRLHGVFTCAYPPPETHWGCPDNAHPLGNECFTETMRSPPTSPGSGCPGRYQYIQMELINEGDAEEYIKRQPEALLPFNIARNVLFQLAFSVYAAADKFSVKHYDIKMLNLFIQSMRDLQTDLVLRYGIGSHVYALRMPSDQAVIAKLADFGTADITATNTGQPVAISHFTTLENTPPDFLILGDDAKQGHEHDCYGMGLCMLHLFTGGFPYEEIMEKVVCPKNLKKRLRDIWENASVFDYSVVRSIILERVDIDENGDTIGEVDETFYDTLYRFLVLFGVPDEPYQQKAHPRVWKAIFESLTVGHNPVRRKKGSKSNDVAQYNRDCKRYSIRYGTNEYIARARGALASIDGGLELLFALCNFDPMKRATAMQVLNSKFMEDLREDPNRTPCYEDAHVQSYMSFYYGESVAF